MKKDTSVVRNAFSICAVSDTGLPVLMAPHAPKLSASGRKREVGLFYFIWLGADSHQSTNYNNAEILKKLPDPDGRADRFTLAEWQSAGGGSRGQFHFWDEPMFGFYNNGDAWVIERHVRMFLEAGIDYLVLDFTNGVFPDYIEHLEVLFRSLNKYSAQGFSVPKVALMAYDDGPGTVNTVYERFYSVHPEFSHLFYHWNGHEKPLIFDNIAGYNKHATALIDTEEKMASYRPEVREFFEIRDVAFPHETKVPYHVFPEKTDTMLYLDFRPEPKKVYGSDGESYINISLSEIEGTNSAAAQWYRDTADRSRSWDGTCNRYRLPGEQDAAAYGYNFARQFEIALREEPDNIFITGWNEWVAQLQVGGDPAVINLIDNADLNNSRDIEPMRGGYRDNYYLQLCHYVARYKGLNDSTCNAFRKTIDVGKSFSQWEDDGIPAYTGCTDTVFDRNSFEAYKVDAPLTDTSGRNDLALAKACEDESYYYFYIQTSEPVAGYAEENGMTLFLAAGNRADYDAAVNRLAQTDSAGLSVEVRTPDGAWQPAGLAAYRAEGNQMMVAVPKSVLPKEAAEHGVAFKWADHFEEDRTSFYTKGSALPFGKFNLLYQGK